MATPAEVIAAVAAKVEALTGATRLASDLRNDFEQIALGASRYQLVGIVGGFVPSSATPRVQVAMRLTVARRLGAGEAERTYTMGAMLTNLSQLLTPDWWRTVTGVHDVVVAPAMDSDDLVRVGNVISYQVDAVVSAA